MTTQVAITRNETANRAPIPGSIISWGKDEFETFEHPQYPQFYWVDDRLGRQPIQTSQAGTSTGFGRTMLELDKSQARPFMRRVLWGPLSEAVDQTFDTHGGVVHLSPSNVEHSPTWIMSGSYRNPTIVRSSDSNDMMPAVGIAAMAPMQVFGGPKVDLEAPFRPADWHYAEGGVSAVIAPGSKYDPMYDRADSSTGTEHSSVPVRLGSDKLSTTAEGFARVAIVTGSKYDFASYFVDASVGTGYKGIFGKLGSGELSAITVMPPTISPHDPEPILFRGPMFFTLTVDEFAPAHVHIEPETQAEAPIHPIIQAFARGFAGECPSASTLEAATKIVEAVAQRNSKNEIEVDDTDGALSFELRSESRLLVVGELSVGGNLHANVYDDQHPNAQASIEEIWVKHLPQASVADLIALF